MKNSFFSEESEYKSDSVKLHVYSLSAFVFLNHNLSENSVSL